MNNNPNALPPGNYILNNGPKIKNVGGRFSNGSHASIKKLFQNTPGIAFTSKPEKADFVILPEGVTEPGQKIRHRNPALSDSRTWFSMDAIGHTLKSESYRRSKKADTYQYVLNDRNSGTIRQIDIPEEIAPSGRASFLLTAGDPKQPKVPYFSRIEPPYNVIIENPEEVKMIPVTMSEVPRGLSPVFIQTPVESEEIIQMKQLLNRLKAEIQTLLEVPNFQTKASWSLQLNGREKYAPDLLRDLGNTILHLRLILSLIDTIIRTIANTNLAFFNDIIEENKNKVFPDSNIQQLSDLFRVYLSNNIESNILTYFADHNQNSAALTIPLLYKMNILGRTVNAILTIAMENYSTDFKQDMKNSFETLNCPRSKENRVCDKYDSLASMGKWLITEQPDFDGESVVHLMQSLFYMVCRILDDAQLSPQTKFTAKMENMEDNFSTLIDLNTYIFQRIYLQQSSPIDLQGCDFLHHFIAQLSREASNLKMTNLSFRNVLNQCERQPELYLIYQLFLFPETSTRQDIFIQLNNELSQLDEMTRKTLTLMFLLAGTTYSLLMMSDIVENPRHQAYRKAIFENKTTAIDPSLTKITRFK